MKGEAFMNGSGGLRQYGAAALAIVGVATVLFANATLARNANATVAREATSIDKLTYHYDRQRTGWYARESQLTPQSVSSSSFGQLWQSAQFDSAAGVAPRLYASPLYVDEVELSGGEHAGRRYSVVFAVTTTGFAYAVNAFERNKVAPGTALWRTQLADKPCAKGTLGNLSTPVIDLTQQRLYVTSCDEDEHWQVHALDIRSGAEISGWPVALTNSTLNKAGLNKNGATQFPENNRIYQRGALNLSADGSRLYVAFGLDSSSGWMVALDTVRAQVATAFTTTASTAEYQGGMWASGGPSIDTQGKVHIATGASYVFTAAKAGIPGVFPDSEHNWGQSIIQLADSAQGFQLTGTYTPFDYCKAAAADIDLGSSGTLVVDLDPATTSTPHLVALVGGKQGNAYLLDRDRMPGSLVKRQPCSEDSATDLSLLAPENQPQFGKRGPINVFGPYSASHGWFDLAKSRTTGAYFRDAAGSHYLFGTGSSKQAETSSVSVPPGLVRLKIITQPATPAYLKVDQLERTLVFLNPGSPVITSEGSANAIVWVLDLNAPRTVPLWGKEPPKPVLYALDALTFKVLWQSKPGELYTSGKYNEPTIARGTVFVGTDRIQAFGLGASGTYATAQPWAAPEVPLAGEAAIDDRAVAAAAAQVDGGALFAQRCVMCHGAGLAGAPRREVLATLSHEKILETLRNGVMEAQAFGLSEAELNALASFLTSGAAIPGQRKN